MGVVVCLKQTKNKTGVWLDGELQKRFEDFAKTHEIIDWHTTQQSQSQSWYIVVRYWDTVNEAQINKGVGAL